MLIAIAAKHAFPLSMVLVLPYIPVMDLRSCHAVNTSVVSSIDINLS